MILQLLNSKLFLIYIYTYIHHKYLCEIHRVHIVYITNTIFLFLTVLLYFLVCSHNCQGMSALHYHRDSSYLAIPH